MTAREQLISDVLVTAVEGGSNYWANDRADDGSLQVNDIERDDDLNILSIAFNRAAVENVSGAKVHDGTIAIDDGVTALVTHASIERALRTISEGKVKVHAGIKASARGLHFGDSDTDYDAEVADVILQVALFGDVIYG